MGTIRNCNRSWIIQIDLNQKDIFGKKCGNICFYDPDYDHRCSYPEHEIRGVRKEQFKWLYIQLKKIFEKEAK